MNKNYISAQQLLCDSFQLGLEVLQSEFKPELLVAIWRGGSSIGIAMQEVLSLGGLHCKHMPVCARSYSGIEQQHEVIIEGLEPLFNHLEQHQVNNILLIDDVFDTGNTIQSILSSINTHVEDSAKISPPTIKIATPYFKPANNSTEFIPDYYLHTSNDWLVFPHELLGLSKEELLHQKPDIEALKSRIARFINNNNLR